MPPPTTTDDILTPEQAQFLSKYLHAIPKKKKKQAPEKAFNEDLTKHYKSYLKYKTLCLERLGRVKQQAQAAEIRYDAGGGDDDAFETALDVYKTKIRGFDSRIGAEIRKAETAEEDSPVFEDAAQQMKIYWQHLKPMRSSPPVPPKSRGVGKEQLLAYLDEAKALFDFKDVREFDRAAAETTLESRSSDKHRAQRLGDHDTLVQGAIDKITDLLKTTRATVKDQGAACDTAESLLADVRKQRKPIIASIAMRLAAPAIKELEKLASAKDPVAMREVERLEEIKSNRESLKKASASLRRQIKAKQDEIDGKGRDLEENPIGFAEMRTLRAELEELNGRREDTIARSRQLLHYTRSAPERLAKIEANAETLKDAKRYVDDLDEMIKEFLAENHDDDSTTPPTTLEALDPSHKQLLLGGKAKKGKGDKDGNVNGRFQELRAQFERSRNRISVDARLFPTEKDLTDITQEQLDVLNQMLDKAKGLAVGDKLAEADFLMNEAAKMHLTFLGANKFALPEMEEAVPTASDRVEKAIAELTVALDRFWGRGGDADDALRKRLNAIVDARALSDPKKQMSAGEAEKKLAVLQADLLKAEARFKPSPADVQAREDAEKTQQSVNAGLLKLYETSKVSEKDLGKVKPDNLITIIGSDGKPTYYEIKTERGGTRKVPKDKDIPLDVILQLEQQAAMLAVLSAGDAPDCADEIEAAIKASEDMLKNATDGGPDYKHIKSQIQSCDKLLQDSDYQTWTPKSLEPCRTELEHFKKTYLQGMTAAEAKTKIDALHTKMQGLKGELAKMKTDYNEVSGLLDALELQLKGGKKAKDGSPGDKLQDLLKGGEKAILKGFDTGPLGVQDMMTMNGIIDGIKADIQKLLDTGKHSTGYESPLKKDIATARQTLDARTQAAITRARGDVRRITDDMKAEMDALNDKKPSDGLAYIQQIAAFLKQARSGAEAVVQTEKDMEAAKTAAKDALKSAKEKLDEAKATLGSYTEYKAVYDSIETQITNTGKTYKNSKDPEWAKSQYKMQEKNAKELLSDLQKFTPINTPGKPIDLSKWQTALDTNIVKVGNSAESAASILEERAKDDPDQARDVELQKAVVKAAAALRSAKAVAVAKMVKMKAELQTRASDVFAETNDAKRKKDMAIVREAAMAEVRRIRATLEANPSLEIYRNNPFDHGLGWAQFIATLHSLEVKIMTELKPR